MKYTITAMDMQEREYNSIADEIIEAKHGLDAINRSKHFSQAGKIFLQNGTLYGKSMEAVVTLQNGITIFADAN